MAGVLLAVAGALSVVLGLLAKPEDFGVDNTLTLGMMILAGAFGADAFFDGKIADEDLEVALSTSSYPLTVTVIAVCVGVLAFRRMVRDYPSVLPALGDALRVALFTSVPLFIGALVFRSDIDELGGGWIAGLDEELGRGDSGTWGASAPGALFTSFALVAFVLLLACVARRGEWWPAAARPTVEWVAPAVQGVALMAALLPVTATRATRSSIDWPGSPEMRGRSPGCGRRLRCSSWSSSPARGGSPPEAVRCPTCCGTLPSGAGCCSSRSRG